MTARVEGGAGGDLAAQCASSDRRRGASLAALALLAFVPSCKEEEVLPPPPPPTVQVAEVTVEDVPVHTEAIGETRGNAEIEIRARVEGFVETVDFAEGSVVTKGQLLYTIDARPFQAQLATAKANQAEAVAQLARAHQDVVRYEPLVAKNAISREEYETAVAIENSAEAAVEAAKAVVSQAEIDLTYTRVVAPEDGLVGKTEVYAGTLVGRGQSTLMTRISRIDPIHVRATFTEKDYLAYARRQGTGTPSADEQGRDSVPFELVLSDDSVHTEKGRLVFIDRNVDPRTGTILLEAAFPNPGNILRPGQFARLRAQVEVRKGAILVPQRAVLEVQGIRSVIAVGKDDVAEQRIVTVAERRGALWVIVNGLAAGDRIVVEGIQKARNGQKVTPVPVPAQAPPTAPDGKPAAGPEPAPAAAPGEKH